VEKAKLERICNTDSLQENNKNAKYIKIEKKSRPEEPKERGNGKDRKPKGIHM